MIKCSFYLSLKPQQQVGFAMMPHTPRHNEVVGLLQENGVMASYMVEEVSYSAPNLMPDAKGNAGFSSVTHCDSAILYVRPL